MSHFLDEPIQPVFNQPPLFEKKPTCPDAFIWRGETHPVTAVLAEWVDATRHGRMSRNMRPAHARRAAVIGSWGVGRFYFRVRTASTRIFDVYYDRAPGDSTDRKGAWFVWRERDAGE